MNTPRIAITSGEPAGIGPDLCIEMAQSSFAAEMVVFGDPGLLAARAAQLKRKISFRDFNPAAPAQAHRPGTLTVVPLPVAEPCRPGQLNPHNSRYVLDLIRQATQACLDGGMDAMVTAPVHKGIINDAGFAFSGHTEFIADICGGNPLMLLATPGLRVALATTHLPIAEVSRAITPELLTQVLITLDQGLRRHFELDSPRILVCGLNPHAGENGHLGREEIDIIAPVIARLQSQGMNIQGPLPADTVFTRRNLQRADAVLAMYHDQGLPVLKHIGFGKAVNITLGLPIIRTSVDHGTALDLAGSGRADSGSLHYAIETAVQMASTRESRS